MAEQKEKWQGWLALSTAVMAVLAALTTLYMGKYSSRAIMAQGQESDQWAYYQAKSIKGHTFEISKTALELQYAADRARMPPLVRNDYETTIAKYAEEMKRYDAEKKEIKTKAEAIASRKLKAQDMGGNFAYSLIFLQIAIMLSSIASLTKRHYLWYIALACNAGWLFFFLDAWFLFY
jgi:ABC-type multidrug transport system fused ATPase/permease subunit